MTSWQSHIIIFLRQWDSEPVWWRHGPPVIHLGREWISFYGITQDRNEIGSCAAEPRKWQREEAAAGFPASLLCLSISSTVCCWVGLFQFHVWMWRQHLIWQKAEDCLHGGNEAVFRFNSGEQKQPADARHFIHQLGDAIYYLSGVFYVGLRRAAQKYTHQYQERKRRRDISY